MKKIVTIVLAIALMLSLTAGAMAADKEIIKITYCAPDQNDTQMVMNKCIELAVERYNEANPDVEVQYNMMNAQFDLQTQITQVESVITNQVDVLIFFACDTEGARSILQQAMDAGVIVIDAVGTIDYQGFVDCVFVGTGEEQYADMLDEWIQTNYDKTGTQLKAGVIYGLLTQTPQLPRGDRRIAYAEAHPEQVEIIANNAGDWNTEKAMGITEDWVVAHPEMNTIFCANTDMAIGVGQALIAAGKNLDEFILTTVDLTENALYLMDQGQVDVICGVDLCDQAARLIQLAIDMYNGDYTEDICYMDKMWCITTENAQEYKDYSAEWNALVNAK